MKTLSILLALVAAAALAGCAGVAKPKPSELIETAYAGVEAACAAQAMSADQCAQAAAAHAIAVPVEPLLDKIQTDIDAKLQAGK